MYILYGGILYDTRLSTVCSYVRIILQCGIAEQCNQSCNLISICPVCIMYMQGVHNKLKSWMQTLKSELKS